jgi:nucleoside-diphosphate-sugar epimerase
MKALVTGSSGFLGRHFVRALRDHGHEVRCVDVAGREPLDARDYFRRATSRVDLAIHCAAVVGGRQTIEGAPLELAVDLSLDAELFQWAARTRPGRVVYISSSAAYPVAYQDANGATAEYRLREDDVDPWFDFAKAPDLLYGWSKLTGELLARHARAAGVAVTVVRPFTGYGADQDPAYPFRAFIDRARSREDPFVVWGDGEQVRDFIHVSDIVAATLKLAEEGIEGPVNLGTGIGTSFNELAPLVCRAAGYQPRIEHRTDQPVGVRYRVADPTLMLQHYQPRVSLEEGARMALGQEAVA